MPTLYTFGEFVVDGGLYQLRRGGEHVRLEPKVFDFLLFLIRHREHVCSKDELLDGIWPGEAVSESVLPTNAAAVRRALRGDPVGDRAIQTIRGRGYRFVAEIAESDAEDPPDEGSVEADPTTVFIGRDVALASLERAFERAINGHGSLTLLVGEPGIGKTHTAREVGRRVEAKGAQVLVGRCYEGEGAPAYWPWLQVLRQSIRDGNANELRDVLGPAAQDLADLLPELDVESNLRSPFTGRPESSRFRLFDGITRYLEARSRARPLVLILDDLHWADKPSLLLLQFLNRELPRLRVLVIGAFRDVEVRRNRALSGVLGALGREPHCSRITLSGFDRDETERFVEVRGHPQPDPSFLEAVYEMTAGNPFFVGQIADLWSGEGLVSRADFANDRAALPQGVKDAVGRRLDSVSNDCNRVLRLASVVGRELRLTLLASLAELSGDDLLAVLEESVRARLLRIDRVGGYSFVHALIRETLYEELAMPERISIHRKIAELLESAANEAPSHLAERAYHLFQATPGGDIEKAIAACSEAAEQCVRSLAFEEAVHHSERALLALDMLPADDLSRRAELLLALAEAQDLASEFTKSSETGKRAAACARSAERADLLARAALIVRGRYDLRAPYGDGRSALEESLDALADRDPVLRARVLARLSQTPPYRDDLEARGRLSRESIELARTHNDDEALLEALASRVYPGLLGPDDDELRLEVAEELMTVARRTGNRMHELNALESRIRSNLSFGKMKEVDYDCNEYRRIAEQLGELGPLFFATFIFIARTIGDGRFSEVEAEIKRGTEFGDRLARFSQMESAGAMAIAWWQRIWVCKTKGDFEGAPEESFDIEMFEPSMVPVIRCVRMMVAFGRGDQKEAQQAYEDLASDHFEEFSRDEWWFGCMAMLAEAAYELGDSKRAAVLYSLLWPYTGRNVVQQLTRTYMGSADHFLGLLATCTGALTAAEQHFEASLVFNKKIGARPAWVWTQMAYARLHQVAGATGTPLDAARRFRLAADEASAIGMERVAETALRLANSARSES